MSERCKDIDEGVYGDSLAMPLDDADGEGELVQTLHGWIPSRKPRLSFYELFWVFFINSVVGLGIETVFIAIVEHRLLITYGLVWGPFSPIYGFGALLYTAVLWKFWDSRMVVVFLVSFTAGIAFEFIGSLFMQYVFGVICWDYSGYIGSIGMRTNLFVGVGWGLLGIAWVNILFPLLSRFIDLIPGQVNRVLCVGFCLFLAIDFTFTVVAFNRQSQRAEDIPATTPIERMTDQLFPQDWMAVRFANQIVQGRGWDSHTTLGGR